MARNVWQLSMVLWDGGVFDPRSWTCEREKPHCAAARSPTLLQF
jgi:hypothetical protein